MSCRHRNAHNCGRPCATASGEPLALAFRWCDDCLDYVPLGPSDETDPRVAVEIRAAELAVLSVERRDSAPIGWCSIQEWLGLDADDDIGEGYLAGYLARCIVDHDSATEREAP